MNVQIEHIENHAARLTVDVDNDRLTQAMEKAARRIGQKVNIPGFRKGKAPTSMILKFVGQQAVMEEALEALGSEVYREVLEGTDIAPYAPGNLEDVKTEPSLQLIFTVPKQPEVELEDYRAIRIPFEAPEVEDKAVNDALDRMLEQRAVIETVSRAAQLEDVVKLKVHGEVTHPAHEHEHAHDEPAEVKAEGEQVEPAAEHEHEPFTETFIEDEEQEVLLAENKEKEFMPGFSAHLVGMNAGEEKSFTLAYPPDDENPSLAGHIYNFRATLQEVKARTLPIMNDDFARQATNGEIETLLDLRIRVRKDLQELATREAESKYADQVLNRIVSTATVRYPEAMVEEYTDDILEELDHNLRERGITLAQAMQIQNKDEAAMRGEYRDTAISRLKRGLVLRELIRREQLDISNDELDTHINELSSRFSAAEKEADTFRRMLNQPDTRRNIAFDMVISRLSKRLGEIAKGETSAVSAAPEASATGLSAPDNTPAPVNPENEPTGE